MHREVFKIIKQNCNPKTSFNQVSKILFNEKITNFSGGCGDIMTTHEKMFYLMNQDLEPQVFFGTGKGGYEKYGFKRVAVDFLDKNNNIAFEIDGKNHSQELQKIKDRLKELFLLEAHGIKTARITNEQVEKLLLDKLELLSKKGVLEKWAKSVGLIINQ